MSDIKKQAACAEKNYIVYRHELPLSCPTAEMELWNYIGVYPNYDRANRTMTVREWNLLNQQVFHSLTVMVR